MPTFGDGILHACMDAFAEPVILTRGTIIILTRGIFQRHATLERTDSDGAPISIRCPLLGIHLADLAGFAPVQGDVVQVDGGTWRVLDAQPDGQGGVTLPLTARPDAESSLP